MCLHFFNNLTCTFQDLRFKMTAKDLRLDLNLNAYTAGYWLGLKKICEQLWVYVFSWNNHQLYFLIFSGHMHRKTQVTITIPWKSDQFYNLIMSVGYWQMLLNSLVQNDYHVLIQATFGGNLACVVLMSKRY